MGTNNHQTLAPIIYYIFKLGQPQMRNMGTCVLLKSITEARKAINFERKKKSKF